MLSLLHHDNLVNLIGYCADGDQRLLVYEYMPLRSLEDHLLGTTTNTTTPDCLPLLTIILIITCFCYVMRCIMRVIFQTLIPKKNQSIGSRE